MLWSPGEAESFEKYSDYVILLPPLRMACSSCPDLQPGSCRPNLGSPWRHHTHTHTHHSPSPHRLCQRPHWTMNTVRQTTPECRQCWHQLWRSNGQAHRWVHANTHMDTQTHKQAARSNLIQWHRSSLSVQLTALSPCGRAPLSSQHSFRYLAETFSLCLPFSKACFMLGAPSAVVLQSAISYLPLLLAPFLIPPL